MNAHKMAIYPNARKTIENIFFGYPRDPTGALCLLLFLSFFEKTENSKKTKNN